MDRMWNPESETMTRDQLDIVQYERLRRTLRKAIDSNMFFKRVFLDAGVSLEDFDGPDFLTKFPFITADKLRTEILSSNTRFGNGLQYVHFDTIDGKMVALPCSESDKRQWAHCVARCFMVAGATEEDVLLIGANYNKSAEAFGYHYGADLAKMACIPMGGEDIVSQLNLVGQYKSRVLVTDQDSIERIITAVDSSKTSLGSIEVVMIGRNGNKTREAVDILSNEMGLKAVQIYSILDCSTLGVFGVDCPVSGGVLVWEDHYIVEIIDPDGNRIEDGGEGELVISSLTREAFPILRLRTGIRTRVIDSGHCGCGRTHLSLAPF